jgi:hypothetical protein
MQRAALEIHTWVNPSTQSNNEEAVVAVTTVLWVPVRISFVLPAAQNFPLLSSGYTRMPVLYLQAGHCLPTIHNYLLVPFDAI